LLGTGHGLTLDGSMRCFVELVRHLCL
jgi:hypothetical protein